MSDAVVHVAGLAAVAAAVPVLIVLAAQVRGDAAAVFGTAVYGASLGAMILCSALFNMIPRPDWAWVLQRLDHAAIYLKIAGTYTPFVLLTGQGGALAVMVWIAAALGVALKTVSPRRFRPLAIGLYLAMGWAGVLAGQDMLAALPGPVLALMLTGGALYSLGVAFYLWERLRFHYTIWHVCVLAASMLFYSAVLVLTISPAPVA
jgi:hemolysin III